VTARLTEVEAYGGVGADPASHAHRGRTARNAVRFGGPGVLYVYFTYGMHWCLNVVTGPPGEASAVLLRAGAVVDGLDVARERRAGKSGPPPDRELARGPARLAMVLGVTGFANGTQLFRPDSVVTIGPRPVPVLDAAIRTGPRIGISVGTDTPWRFWLDGEPSVSPFRRATAPRRAP
jgi:DNA-3-methyladenine glycosylase